MERLSVIPSDLGQSAIEFDAHLYRSLPPGIKPSTSGWSGICSKYLSKLFLKASFVLEKYLKYSGRELYNLMPS